ATVIEPRKTRRLYSSYLLPHLIIAAALSLPGPARYQGQARRGGALGPFFRQELKQRQASLVRLGSVILSTADIRRRRFVVVLDRVEAIEIVDRCTQATVK